MFWWILSLGYTLVFLGIAQSTGDFIAIGSINFHEYFSKGLRAGLGFLFCLTGLACLVLAYKPGRLVSLMVLILSLMSLYCSVFLANYVSRERFWETIGVGVNYDSGVSITFPNWIDVVMLMLLNTPQLFVITIATQILTKFVTVPFKF